MIGFLINHFRFKTDELIQSSRLLTIYLTNLLLFGVYGLVINLLGWRMLDTDAPKETVELIKSGPVSFFLILIVVVALEEIVFRVMAVPMIGVVPAGLLFGALHYFNLYSLVSVFYMSVFGIASGYFYEATKNFWVIFLPHLVHNVFIVYGLRVIFGVQ
jgi:membrane protease YdiL (CAAX protease family)